MTDLLLEERSGALRFRVRVKPRAAKSRILAVREGALEVAVAAPPADGAANAELIRLIATTIGLGKTAIEIVSGAGSRSKLVSVTGLSAADLVARIGASTPEHPGLATGARR